MHFLVLLYLSCFFSNDLVIVHLFLLSFSHSQRGDTKIEKQNHHQQQQQQHHEQPPHNIQLDRMQNTIQWDSLYHIMSRCSRCTYCSANGVYKYLVRNLFHLTMHSLVDFVSRCCCCCAALIPSSRCWFVLPIWHIRQRRGACMLTQAHCKMLKMDRNTFCERCELWMHNDQEITMMYLRLFRVQYMSTEWRQWWQRKKNANRL